MVKAKCPFCNSYKVENYGINNIAINSNELEIGSIMVESANCKQFYEINIMV